MTKIKNKLDLAIGNPQFLQPYWGEFGSEAISIIRPNFSMDYLKNGSIPGLIHQINQLHININNTEMYFYDTVIGCGATQLIFASMYALSKMHGYTAVYVPKPYWFRFPEMIRRCGLKFVTRPSAKVITILTSPNNPTGFPYLSNDWSPKTIFDVCYNWPQYLIDRDGRSHSFTIKQDIMIFSLAKATGHAGTRIGWALVRDTQIARYMEDYIEYTTGGVSVEAQHKCLSLLNHQNNLFRLGANHYTCFGVGKSILQSRWNDLYNAWKTNKYTILNKYGMFVWCRGANNCNAATFERATQTSVISGKICGSDNRYFRINIGCSEKNFEEFINRVNKIK